jgi:TPR repeat protein
VPQDDKLCAIWIREAAEQGNGYAEGALGGLYLLGQGVPRDTDAAGYWLKKAADQGGFVGDWALASELATGVGVGVKQDLVQAYRKMNLAMALLDETKRAKRKPAVDLLAKMMTPAQIAEAERQIPGGMPKPEQAAGH